jgi:hypothetical protein
MKLRIVLALALIVAIAVPAAATSLRKMELEELVDNADLIVLGTVAKVEFKPVGNRASVVTDATINVEQTLKGAAGKSVKVRVPGGKLDKKTLKVFGAPTFTEGDRYFLLLRKDVNDSTVHRVAGFFQGRYLIYEEGGETFGVSDHGKGRQVLEKCQGKRNGCLKSSGMTVIKLEELTQRVKARIGVESGTDK